MPETILSTLNDTSFHTQNSPIKSSILIITPLYRQVNKSQDRMVTGERFESRQSAPGRAFWVALWPPSKYTRAIRPLVLDTFWSPPSWLLACSMHLPSVTSSTCTEKHTIKRVRQEHGGPSCRVEVSGTMGGRRGNDNPSIVILETATVIHPQGGSP